MNILLKRSLTAYDENFMNVTDDYVIDYSNNLRVDDYLGSRAHLAAMAFAEVSGLSLGAFVDRRPADPKAAGLLSTRVEHAFCRLPSTANYCLDARGPRSGRDLFDEYCANTAQVQELGDHEAMALIELQMREGVLAPYLKGERQHLEHHFLQMKAIGLLQLNALVVSPGMLYEDEFSPPGL
ncbi:hypothetical protein DV532_26505 (plasmid) [Pseudomonas sp. Leaf58]|uniref:hypothetical protein n=1 Tax=Pseudomonas sp. Leaf58 TaxID=1736226 RepID=UPI0006FFCCC4|nr:hypothetical protein [Pseudomonas sp. Leaf58]AYG47838.1 hypothetical protein DV532_26505 [Pseudomonas sp. Leaf58]KQN62596.1 hypothetical protein ASF02_10645 [Pseudomonas sp. Leaf58]